MDVSSLYTNIPIQDGLDSMKVTFDDFFDPTVNKFHQDYLLRLLEILLNSNIFEFDGKIYIYATYRSSHGESANSNICKYFHGSEIR